MTAQPTHEGLDRRPTWTVQGVFDPDVTGQDFCYTIGLHDRGLPELHLFANPTEGSDPGEDWAFSMADRCYILNGLAFDLIDGKVGVGSTVERSYDGGLATVCFRLDPPGDRESLQAYGIAPGAEVLPVAWSLQRPPTGPLTRMTKEAELAMQDEYFSLLPTQRLVGLPPSGWRRAPFSADPEQEFGPRTPIVMIRAAQLWSCRDLGALVNTFGPVAMEQGLSGPTNVDRCLARTVGRSPALEQIRARTHALVDHVIASAGSEWDFTLRLLEPDYDALDQRARDSLDAHAAELVAQATLAVLSVEAIADIADESLLLAARGPWLTGLNPSLTLPGPEWSAGPRVRRRVRRILRPLDLAAWSRINALHNHARDLESDYDHLCWRLTARFLTSATGCPWSRLSDLPAARELRQVIGRGRPYEGLVEWASCLAALMSDRARYSHADIEVFAAAVRDVLPQLERELNRIQ